MRCELRDAKVTIDWRAKCCVDSMLRVGPNFDHRNSDALIDLAVQNVGSAVKRRLTSYPVDINTANGLSRVGQASAGEEGIRGGHQSTRIVHRDVCRFAHS